MTAETNVRRIVVVAAALVAAAVAQDLVPKAPPQKRPVVLTGATVHPVSRPPFVGAVRFADGRLTHVGDAPTAAGDDVVDAKGLHLYPGLISPWTQLGMNEIASVRATQDYDEAGAVSPEVLAVTAVNPDSWLLPVTRRNGILTACVAPTGGAVAGRAGVVRMDGWTNVDLAVRADAGVVVTWPRMRAGGGRGRGRGPGLDAPAAAEADPADDVRRAVALIEDAFRAAERYFDARTADPDLPVDVRWEGLRSVLRPADEAARRPVFALADDVEQIHAALAFAARFGVRLVIVGGRDAEHCAEAMKRRDVPVVIDGIFKMPKRADAAYDEAFTRPKRLEAAGVRWCLASGEETAHERNLPYAAGLAVAYGLAPEAALRAITLSAAEILGVGAELGSLDAGKAATLFACDGDPLLATTKILRAWIDGREIALVDKQTALYDKYRLRYAGR